MKSGIELIQEERRRQIESEGYDAEHDDSHKDCSILAAAIAYAMAAENQAIHSRPDMNLIRTMYWPWGRSWWKPKGRIHNLVKAGALIAAEIDRLQRMGAGK